MTISMDGLRLSLLKSYNKLATSLNNGVDGDITQVNTKELKEIMDELQQDVGIFLCVYDEKQENFSLLYDKHKTIEFNPDDLDK